MPKFRVSVTRTTYDMLDFVVEAENEEQAETLAIEKAGAHDWRHSTSAEYEIEHTEVVEGEETEDYYCSLLYGVDNSQ